MKSKQCQQQNKTLGQNSAGTSGNFAELLLKIRIYWPAAETMKKVSHSVFIYWNLYHSHVWMTFFISKSH